MAYDFCILGAGIAGLSLADSLAEQNYSVTVLEKDEIASGASGTLAGLVNPATGRRGKKTWKAEKCYQAIRQNLEKVQAYSSASFFQNNGLLRPALTKKMARKMKETYDQTDWPEGWCHWQTESQIKERHPGVNCIDGGLWLPIGLTVDVTSYLKAYASLLQSSGVDIHTQVNANYHQKNDQWDVDSPGISFKSQYLVFATGLATVDHHLWNFLPLEGVKGQIALFKAGKSLLNFNHSISSMGYIARLGNTNEFIQGSTYEHGFDNLETNEEGEKYLRSRTEKVLPELAKNAELVNQWAGARINTPDRKPVLGEHPKIKNLHVFTGLSSKGLMVGKFLANHYADHLKNDSPLFPEVSIERF